MLSKVLCKLRVINIDVSGGIIGDDAGCMLARALAHNTVVKSIEMKNTSVGYKTAEELGNVVQHSKSLQYMSLEGNNLSGSPDSTHGFAKACPVAGKQHDTYRLKYIPHKPAPS